MCVSKLGKLFSTVFLAICFFVIFYNNRSHYQSTDSISEVELISNDLIALQRNKKEAEKHNIDSRIIKQVVEHGSADKTTMPPTLTPAVDDQSSTEGFTIVGEGLRVPKGKDKNFLFIKTHKCGTSTLVNMFYLFGIRRRLNFVTQPWNRWLDVEA